MAKFFVVLCACLSLSASALGVLRNSLELRSDTEVDPAKADSRIWRDLYSILWIEQEIVNCTHDPVFNQTLIKYQRFLNGIGSRAHLTTMLEQFEQLKLQFENVTEDINSKMNEAKETIQTLEKSADDKEVVEDLSPTARRLSSDEWLYGNSFIESNRAYRGLTKLKFRLNQFHREVPTESNEKCPSKGNVERWDEELADSVKEIGALEVSMRKIDESIQLLKEPTFEHNPSTWRVQYSSFKNWQQKIQYWAPILDTFEKLIHSRNSKSEHIDSTEKGGENTCK